MYLVFMISNICGENGQFFSNVFHVKHICTTRKTLFYDAHSTSIFRSHLRIICDDKFVIMFCVNDDSGAKPVFVWMLQRQVQLWLLLIIEIHNTLKLTPSWYAKSIKRLTLARLKWLTDPSLMPLVIDILKLFPLTQLTSSRHSFALVGFWAKRVVVVERVVLPCNC